MKFEEWLKEQKLEPAIERAVSDIVDDFHGGRKGILGNHLAFLMRAVYDKKQKEITKLQGARHYDALLKKLNMAEKIINECLDDGICDIGVQERALKFVGKYEEYLRCLS